MQRRMSKYCDCWKTGSVKKHLKKTEIAAQQVARDERDEVFASTPPLAVACGTLDNDIQQEPGK